MVHMMYEISMLRTVYVDGRVSVNVCALKSVSILCRKNILMEWHSKAKILNHGMMFHYRFLSLSVFLKKTERERDGDSKSEHFESNVGIQKDHVG